MNFMKRVDLVISLIWIILGINICMGSIKLTLRDFHNPGPGLVPFLTGVFLALFGLILMFSSILEEPEDEEKLVWVKETWKRVLLTLLALCGYGLLLELLGFLITTFLFFFFLVKLAEPKKWMTPIVFSGVTAILCYLVFSVGLKSQLPRGILGF
jgi:putative tricarboxylic transport membrane protein